MSHCHENSGVRQYRLDHLRSAVCHPPGHTLTLEMPLTLISLFGMLIAAIVACRCLVLTQHGATAFIYFQF